MKKPPKFELDRNAKRMTGKELEQFLKETLDRFKELAEAAKTNKEARETVNILLEGLLIGHKEKSLVSKRYAMLYHEFEQYLKDLERAEVLTGKSVEEMQRMSEFDLLDLLEESRTKVEQRINITKRPENRQEITDATTQKIFKEPRYDKLMQINTSADSQIQYKMTISEDFTKLEELKIKRDISEFDKQVLIAIYSLAETGEYEYNGLPLIPLNAIAKMLSADFEMKPTKQQIETIKKSINRMRFTDIMLDMHGEQNKYKDEKIEEFYKKRKQRSMRQSANMLEARQLEIDINGNLTEAIQVLAEPLIVSYCKLRGYIRRVSLECIQTPSIENRESNLIIKAMLINLITKMKSAKNISRNITYDYAYKFLELELDPALQGADKKKEQSRLRKQKNRARETMKKILSDFKDNGFIVDYEELPKTGNKLHGIKIILITNTEKEAAIEAQKSIENEEQ